MPANKQPQKATAAAAILGWLLSLAAARGVQVPVDPGVLLRIDRGTLVRVVEGILVTLSRPMVSGAAALMELLSRAVLLLLAVILCATPSKREVVLQRVRALLKEQVEVAVRSWPPPAPSAPPHTVALRARAVAPPPARPLPLAPSSPAGPLPRPLAPAPAAVPLVQLSPGPSRSRVAGCRCACPRHPRLLSRSLSCRDAAACRMCWSWAPPGSASRL